MSSPARKGSAAPSAPPKGTNFPTQWQTLRSSVSKLRDGVNTVITDLEKVEREVEFYQKRDERGVAKHDYSSQTGDRSVGKSGSDGVTQKELNEAVDVEMVDEDGVALRGDDKGGEEREEDVVGEMDIDFMKARRIRETWDKEQAAKGGKKGGAKKNPEVPNKRERDDGGEQEKEKEDERVGKKQKTENDSHKSEISKPLNIPSYSDVAKATKKRIEEDKKIAKAEKKMTGKDIRKKSGKSAAGESVAAKNAININDSDEEDAGDRRKNSLRTSKKDTAKEKLLATKPSVEIPAKKESVTKIKNGEKEEKNSDDASGADADVKKPGEKKVKKGTAVRVKKRQPSPEEDELTFTDHDDFVADDEE